MRKASIWIVLLVMLGMVACGIGKPPASQVVGGPSPEATVIVETVTPTPSATPGPSLTPTASPTPQPPSPTPTVSATPQPPSPTATAVPPSETDTPTPTLTPTPSPSATPSPAPTLTATPSPSPAPAATATPESTAPSSEGGQPGHHYLPMGEAGPEPGHPCPGCQHAPGYIIGNVFDAGGRPLCGVRVVCYNDWYRYPVVGTKGGGEYDIMVLQAEATWYVVVLDEADQPISPEAPVHFNPIEACWYRLNWQRTD